MDAGKWARVLVGGAVVLIVALTFRQAVAISETASASAREASAELEVSESSPAMPRAIRPSGVRVPPDLCFDVPLKEAASCRTDEAMRATQLVDSPRLLPDVCFDVPLREVCDE